MAAERNKLTYERANNEIDRSQDDAVGCDRVKTVVTVQRTTSSSVFFELEQEAGCKQSVRRQESRANDCTGGQKQRNQTSRENR
ncbi:Hypothetical predicted protein [Pelobates cultripes]|uniref:Uncharacterized protein n=1 Tax=Pelobates cultripes TaxID=61616 RepID=A0AAD1TJL2_PELCU|nr:Hypothetical predicted protein [Pelobates cultripes]